MANGSKGGGYELDMPGVGVGGTPQIDGDDPQADNVNDMATRIEKARYIGLNYISLD